MPAKPAVERNAGATPTPPAAATQPGASAAGGGGSGGAATKAAGGVAGSIPVPASIGGGGASPIIAAAGAAAAAAASNGAVPLAAGGISGGAIPAVAGAGGAAGVGPVATVTTNSVFSFLPPMPPSWILLVLFTLFYIGMWIRRWLINQQRKHPVPIVPPFEKAKVNIGRAAGVHSIQGRRQHMEDTFQAAVDLGGDSKKAFYGVFDGHGGPHASEYTAENLHKLILQQKYDEQPGPALKSGFKQLDHDWLALADRNNFDDGSTAICVLIVQSTLYVCNVGDSRAVLCSGGKAIPLSVDHKPGTRDDEKRRIEKLGGRIVYYGTWRVEGVLAVTRAIGDRRLKQYVSAVPEISERRVQADDEFLILASDGVWDVLTNQDAVDLVKGCRTVQDGARMLTEQSYARGSLDNITSLVIDLNQYK